MAENATVYLIDDDLQIIGLLEKSLGLRGYCVQTYTSAIEFLESFSPDSPGCIVLDYDMPGMNGLEVQKQLNERGSTTPVIFITGHGDIPKTVQALKAGAVDFLEKPFSQEALFERIDEATEKDRDARKMKTEVDALKRRFEKLTERETQIMRLLIAGPANHSSRELARELGISHRTVDHHRTRILEKTGAHSTAELVKLASLAGIGWQ